MIERYIAFDVETPNHANDRMSAIGITVVEGGRIVEEHEALVDPEVPFDLFNIRLTGIGPDQVAGAPTFPALWREIRPLMDSGVLVAHNAPFDMSVLAKCLRGYGIRWHPTVRYACTCQMGRRLLPPLPVSGCAPGPPSGRERQQGLRRTAAPLPPLRRGSGPLPPHL